MKRWRVYARIGDPKQPGWLILHEGAQDAMLFVVDDTTLGPRRVQVYNPSLLEMADLKSFADARDVKVTIDGRLAWVDLP